MRTSKYKYTKLSQDDKQRLGFICRVLNAAARRDILPPAPWYAWVLTPTENTYGAARVYGQQVASILQQENDGIRLGLADVAYRTTKIVQWGNGGTMDIAGVVGMLLRFVYDDSNPMGRELVENGVCAAVELVEYPGREGKD